MGLSKATPVSAAALALSTIIFLSLTADTSAQSRVCRNLQAQLSAVSSGGGRSGAAIASLKRKLDQARSTAHQKRCGALFGKRSQECSALNASIQRMSGELASLQSGQSTGGSAEQQRQQIRAKMRANGCGQRTTKKQAPAQQKAAKPKRAPAQQQAAKPKQTQPQAPARRGKTYRTMCVRLCDGYYFPISFSVPREHFERDEETCHKRCPGTDVALYVHRPGEESDQMISYRNDERYQKLSTAFSYRQSGFRPSCGCSPATSDLSVAMDDKEDRPGLSMETTAALRPSSDEDGQILDVPIPQPAPRRPSEPQKVSAEPRQLPPPEERQVRLVGPKFLPDPSEVIDLRDPDRLPVQ
ncbi:DUF2865 domain-containing protein [Chelativorans sp. YIM 93263]|uniref:DUF2865 domain-containing protein n=1 Tax=Chelativorans sp. YIM 93263 TaxID=2906648 RepID=UPI0023798AD7|nr:DUF2865 domain-containing protein [Chelativorans sp. YIM 93263]